MPHASIKNLKPGAHIHLMGICGTAMASLAGLLKDRGFKVTGSDSNPYPPMSTQIESLGIAIQKPYSKNNLRPKPDFVVVGNVISANNEEAQEMNALDLGYCSLPEAMGEVIIAEKDSYVISGTHGKTTTTSLLSWVAECVGKKPGFLIGGIPKNFSKSFRNPEANTFIIEGDEYDTAYFDKVPKFIHYKPKNVILTSVEFDHADIYADFEAVKNAFRRLMKLIPSQGTLIYCGDDENVRLVADEAKVGKKFSYGVNMQNDYTFKVTDQKDSLTRFVVLHRSAEVGSSAQSADNLYKVKNPEVLGEFVTTMTGEYNLLNATAVIAMSHVQDWPLDKVQKAVSTFTGVKRRQEILGEPGGVLLIEDFAHHPTAVKETIKAIQSKYPNRKVFSIFEPRSATSRRKVFQKDYVDAFSEGQEIILAQAFDQAKLSEDNRFSVDELISDLISKGKHATAFNGADNIVDYIGQQAKSGDVVLIMSNGGFDGIYQKLIHRLSK